MTIHLGRKWNTLRSVALAPCRGTKYSRAVLDSRLTDLQDSARAFKSTARRLSGVPKSRTISASCLPVGYVAALRAGSVADTQLVARIHGSSQSRHRVIPLCNRR